MKMFLYLFLITIFFPLTSKSDTLKELLIPLPQEEAKKIEKRYEYEIALETYFARRYRLIRINADPIISGEKYFTITPFKEETLTVETKKYSQDILHWQGYIVNPSFKFSEPFSDVKREAATFFTITLGEHLLDTNTNEIIPYIVGMVSPLPVDKIEADKVLNKRENTKKVYLAYSELNSVAYLDSYVIKRLANDSDVHIVFLKDRSKSLPGHASNEKSKNFVEFKRNLDNKFNK